MKNGYKQGDMSPEVMNYQKPESCFAEKYDQSPLNYVERQNKQEMKAASKLKGQAYNGRYSK